jgi:hypothetical protein
VSATGEETSAQSTSADNGFIVSSLLTETLSGDHSARLFMTSFDQHASANPEINSIAKNLLQHSADNSLHMPAPRDDGSPAATDEAHATHRHFDLGQLGSFKFVDDDSAHPGKTPHDPPALTALSNDLGGGHSGHPFEPNAEHHASADPKIGEIAQDHVRQDAADNLPHMPAQHGDHGSPAVADGAHSAHPQFDKFADDESAHPGKVTHEPPTALSSALGGEHSAHPGKPNLDHGASGDIAKDHPPQHPADNSPHMPAQHDDNGSPAVADESHPAHPAFDNFKFADDDSGHPGKVSAPALAKTFDVPEPVTPISQPIGDQFISGKSFDHEPPPNPNPDVSEIDHPTTDEIQHLLDIALASNAASPLDPHHALAAQDVIKAQLPQPPGEFHFA